MDPHCPVCPDSVEDNLHPFTCPQQGEWKTNFLSNLDEWLQGRSTSPPLRARIMHGTATYLQAPTTYNSPPIQDVLDSLPWHLLFFGFIPTQWETTQHQHYRELGKDPHKFTGRVWSTRFLKYLWSQLHLQWIAYTKASHEDPDTDPERERLAQQITTLYSFHDQLTPAYRMWLNRPLQEVLDDTIPNQRAWINVSQPPIQQGLALASELNAKRQSTITQYLQVHRPTQRPSPGSPRRSSPRRRRKGSRRPTSHPRGPTAPPRRSTRSRIPPIPQSQTITQFFQSATYTTYNTAAAPERADNSPLAPD